MEILRWKTRIALLWVFMAVGMSAHGITGFLEPSMIEQAMSGELEGVALTHGMLVFMALFWLIPLWLAFVSMTVNDLRIFETNSQEKYPRLPMNINFS